MRDRKPWVFARRLLFGWKVRFDIEMNSPLNENPKTNRALSLCQETGPTFGVFKTDPGKDLYGPCGLVRVEAFNIGVYHNNAPPGTELRSQMGKQEELFYC